MSQDEPAAGSTAWNDGTQMPRSWCIALGTGLVVYAAVVACLWPLDQRIVTYYPQDLIQFLIADKALGLGQTLHIDQLTPVGPLNFHLVGWGAELFGTPAGGFQFVAVFSAAVCLALGTLTVWNRLGPWPASLFVIVAVVTVLAPVNLGETGSGLTIAMHYNRWGFSLLLIIFVCAFLPIDRSRWTLDFLIISIALILCFYIKITYFMVGSVAVIGACFLPIREMRYRRALGLATLLLVVVLIVLPANGDYLGDIVLSGVQSDRAVASLRFYLYLVLGNYDLILALAAAYFVYARFGGERRLLMLTMGLLILGGSFAALSQNNQWHILPSAFAWFIVLHDSLRRSIDPAVWRARRFLFLAVTALYPMIIFYDSGVGIVDYARTTVGDEFVRNARPELAGVVVREKDAEEIEMLISGTGLSPEATAALSRFDASQKKPAAYFAKLMNGHALVGGLGIERPTVLTADAINGVALFGTSVPVPGWYLWVHPGFAALPADPILDAVDVLMIPHQPESPPARDRILSVYGEQIARQFAIATANNLWVACVRADALTTASPAGSAAPCAFAGP